MYDDTRARKGHASLPSMHRAGRVLAIMPGNAARWLRQWCHGIDEEYQTLVIEAC